MDCSLLCLSQNNVCKGYMDMIKILSAISCLVLLSGCASDGGASVGPHGKDSTLSDNKLEGLYLFKIETNQNTINITSHGDAKVAM